MDPGRVTRLLSNIGLPRTRGDGLHHPEVGRQVWRNRRQMSLGQLAVLALLFFRQAEQLQEDLDRIDVGDVVLELAASLGRNGVDQRSEEHTSELQSLMRISYAVFCLKKTNTVYQILQHTHLHEIHSSIHT